MGTKPANKETKVPSSQHLPDWIFEVEEYDDVDTVIDEHGNMLYIRSRDLPLLEELEIDLQQITMCILWMIHAPLTKLLGRPLSTHPLYKSVAPTSLRNRAPPLPPHSTNTNSHSHSHTQASNPASDSDSMSMSNTDFSHPSEYNEYNEYRGNNEYNNKAHHPHNNKHHNHHHKQQHHSPPHHHNNKHQNSPHHPHHPHHPQHRDLNNIDFWGPCSVVSLYCVELWLGKVKSSSWLFVIWGLAGVFNHLVMRVHSKSSLMIHTALLGYSVTPIVLIMPLTLFLPIPDWLASLLEIISVIWAASAAVLCYFTIFDHPHSRSSLLLLVPSIAVMHIYMVSLL